MHRNTGCRMQQHWSSNPGQPPAKLTHNIITHSSPTKSCWTKASAPSHGAAGPTFVGTPTTLETACCMTSRRAQRPDVPHACCGPPLCTLDRARHIAGFIAFANRMFRAHAACECMCFCNVEYIQLRHHARPFVCHHGSFCRTHHVACVVHQTFQHAHPHGTGTHTGHLSCAFNWLYPGRLEGRLAGCMIQQCNSTTTT